MNRYLKVLIFIFGAYTIAVLLITMISPVKHHSIETPRLIRQLSIAQYRGFTEAIHQPVPQDRLAFRLLRQRAEAILVDLDRQHIIDRIEFNIQRGHIGLPLGDAVLDLQEQFEDLDEVFGDHEDLGFGGVAPVFMINLDALPQIGRDLPAIQPLPVVQNRDSPEGIMVSVPNDTENVHDHLVTNSIKESVKKLKEITPITVQSSEIPDIISSYAIQWYLQGKISHKKLSNVMKTLKTIQLSNSKLVAYDNMSELDALVLVWNRINSPDNSSSKDDLIFSLLSELEDSKQVCSTGRFNRIIDTLNILDPLVKIKPLWAIQQEILDKASVIQRELIDSQSNEIQEAMNATVPSAEQTKLVNDYTENLKSVLRRTFKEQYTDTGILTLSELNKELDKWIDYI